MHITFWLIIHYIGFKFWGLSPIQFCTNWLVGCISWRSVLFVEETGVHYDTITIMTSPMNSALLTVSTLS